MSDLLIGMIVGGMFVTIGRIVTDKLAESKVRHYTAVISQLLTRLERYDPALTSKETPQLGGK